MAEAAISITSPNFTVLDGGLSQKAQSGSAVPSRLMLNLCILMAVLQILDGVLTGIGVTLLGISAEGNAVLRFLMEHLGYVETLIISKTIAIGVIGALFVLSTRVHWIERAMKLLIVVYLAFAVVPWSAIILTRLG